MYKFKKSILAAFVIAICSMSISFAEESGLVFVQSNENAGTLNTALTILEDTEKLSYEKEQEAAKQAELEKQKALAAQNESIKHQDSYISTVTTGATSEDTNIMNYIMRKNSSLTKEQAGRIVNAVNRYSSEYGVDKYLIYAIIEKESTFNPSTIYNGAYGLMQLYHTSMPYFGITVEQALNIESNIRAGVQEISSNLNRYSNEVTALSAYNWGSGNVNKGTYNTNYANSVLAKKNAIISAVM